MDMDPITRREADKIESVLDDLITELELVSFLPEEFNLWLRDDIVPTVEQSSLLESLRRKYKKLMKKSSPYNNLNSKNTSGNRFGSNNNRLHEKCNDNNPLDFSHFNDNAHVKSNFEAEDKHNYISSNNNDNVHNEVDEDDDKDENDDDDDSGDRESEDNDDDMYHDEEELQRLMKAMCFVHAASHYGDPADCINNEAITQVTDFNEIERELLETATTLGHVESAKLRFHHLCTRALVDLLRNGFYNTEMQKLLAVCYPANTINSNTDKYNNSDNNDNNNMLFSDVQNGSNQQKSKWSVFSENAQTRAATTFSSSSRQPVSSDEAKWKAKAATIHERKIEYNEEWARSNGVIDKSSSHLKEIMATLAKLIKLRNTFTVNEDVHRYKVLHEAIHKEQSASADVQALNREYEEAKLIRQQEVSELDAEIENLELELNEMQEEADRTLDALNAAHAHVVNERLNACSAQKNQHEVECNNLAEQLKRVQGKHVEEINALRNMRTKKEAAVSGAINEYDSQMSHLHEMINEFQHDAESDSGKVVRVEEQLATLAAEKAEYELEQRVAAQRKDHAEQLAQKMENDVRVIQAYYRAYLIRKNVEREMSKRTKKGKKRNTSVKKSKSTEKLEEEKQQIKKTSKQRKVKN